MAIAGAVKTEFKIAALISAAFLLVVAICIEEGASRLAIALSMVAALAVTERMYRVLRNDVTFVARASAALMLVFAWGVSLTLAVLQFRGLM